MTKQEIENEILKLKALRHDWIVRLDNDKKQIDDLANAIIKKQQELEKVKDENKVPSASEKTDKKVVSK